MSRGEADAWRSRHRCAVGHTCGGTFSQLSFFFLQARLKKASSSYSRQSYWRRQMRFGTEKGKKSYHVLPLVRNKKRKENRKGVFFSLSPSYTLQD